MEWSSSSIIQFKGKQSSKWHSIETNAIVAAAEVFNICIRWCCIHAYCVQHLESFRNQSRRKHDVVGLWLYEHVAIWQTACECIYSTSQRPLVLLTALCQTQNGRRSKSDAWTFYIHAKTKQYFQSRVPNARLKQYFGGIFYIKIGMPDKM